ncbi:MAG: hypothetical protein L6R37_003507 [Teloschistes peruensis]|nr:MAG: hypothetical protein L6R37_003507 [Teloschistes peruensis]
MPNATKKRRRELSSVDTQLVEIYEDLASEDEHIRLKAAQALLQKCSPENGQLPKDQLSEVVRRLIRGLCSGRKAARLGFSIALTELLSQRSDETESDVLGGLALSDLIDLLIKQTETIGNVSGQEERDHQLGRLFCVEAFIKSGILFRDDVPNQRWSRVLDLVYDAARKKAWLREECGWVLYNAIHTLRERESAQPFVQAIVEKLHENALAKTSEGIAIWLAIQRDFPSIQLPGGVWRNDNPLHRKEKSKLAKILKEVSSENASDDASEKLAQKGNWNSRLHFVWNIVLTELAKESVAKNAQDTTTFGEFWQEAVDGGTAPVVHLQALFSRNFTRCLTNQIASKARYLHRAAERCLKTILDRAESESSAAYAALQGLIVNPPGGNLFFDQSTRTKTSEKLIALASDHDLETLVSELLSRFVITVPDEKDAIARRQLIADQLTFCLKSRPPAGTTSEVLGSQPRGLVNRILDFFTKHSYFAIENRDQVSNLSPPVAEKTRDSLRTRLTSCLSHIISRWPGPASFAYHIAETIRKNESVDSSHSTLDTSGPIGDSMASTWKLLDQVHGKIRKDPENANFLTAFELLCSLTVLQVYNGDADAVSMLGELQSCYDLMIKPSDGSNQHGAEILIEVILSFIAKPAQLFRRLALQVFEVFVPEVNGNGLSSMIKVLETKENLSGQDEMFEADDEDQSPSDVESGAASDVEEMEMAEANGVKHISDDEAASEAASAGAEDTDSAEEDDSEELAEFDMKLAQALKTKPINASANPNEDGSSSSDEDMDDEQMEALDAHIATIFRERKKVVSQKSQKKDAKETIVNFKCRVLELLDLFVKKRHSDLLTLDLLLPFLECVRTTTSSLVSSRACNLMREYSRLCKNRSLPFFHDKTAKKTTIRLLKAVHAEAGLEASNAHSAACSQASLILVKILVAAGRENLGKVVKVYAKTQGTMLVDPKSRVKMSFFTDWLNWCSTARPPPSRGR